MCNNSRVMFKLLDHIHMCANFGQGSMVIVLYHNSMIYEPHPEKTSFLHNAKNKGAGELCDNHTADQYLCFRYLDSTIPLFPKSEVSSL